MVTVPIAAGRWPDLSMEPFSSTTSCFSISILSLSSITRAGTTKLRRQTRHGHRGQLATINDAQTQGNENEKYRRRLWHTEQSCSVESICMAACCASLSRPPWAQVKSLSNTLCSCTALPQQVTHPSNGHLRMYCSRYSWNCPHCGRRLRGAGVNAECSSTPRTDIHIIRLNACPHLHGEAGQARRIGYEYALLSTHCGLKALASGAKWSGTPMATTLINWEWDGDATPKA